jgi:serine/threonine protein kinase
MDPRSDAPHDPVRSANPVDPPAAQRIVPSADALDDNAAPTDETPTIISKNGPRPATPPDPTHANELRGRRLAHFELIEQIGVGGMAAVLRARDTQLDRCVALKILPPDLAVDEENIKRFHQEARAAAKLDHDNIARVFFCGEDQRLHFIAFEFVEGDNLRTILEKRTRLPVVEALPYLIQVVAGLAHAAARGVVHRDIKPSNIIITPGGRAKLVDMGLARSMEPQDKGLTQSGVTLGTFDYISPEQALEPRDADVRSDIYSLGCTFYHMITGRPPVPEGTAARKLHHHQHVKPIDPRVLAPGIPDEMALVLDRMMAKDLRQRYQTAEDLLQHLLAVARKLGAATDGPEGGLYVDAVLPTPPGGARLVLAVALAVAAVVGLIFFLPSGETPTDGSSSSKYRTKDETGQGPAPIDREQPKTPTPGPGAPTPPVVPAVAKVQTFKDDPKELRDWLLKQDKDLDRIEIYLTGDLGWDVEPDREPGLVVQARQKVVFKRADKRIRPVIRLTYTGGAFKPRQNPWVALTINSPETEIEGIRFEIDGGAGNPVPMIGLLLQNGENHHLVKDCEFLQSLPNHQPNPNNNPRQLVSIQTDALLSGPQSNVTIKESLFVGYSDGNLQTRQLGTAPRLLEAIVRNGPVGLDVANCAFGPHGCLFHLFNGDYNLPIKVRDCTLLAGPQTAVFAFDENACGRLNVTNCLFSRPEFLGGEGGAVLVRSKDARDKIRFAGKGNRYHNFKAFWVGESGTEVAMNDILADLRKLDKNNKDEGSLVLQEESPWNKPLGMLDLLQEQKFTEAFKVNDQLASLRQPPPDQDRAVGVDCFLGKTDLASLPPLPGVRKDQLFVDPPRNDSANGIFPDLERAVLAARPRDTILIRCNGDLPVKPQRLRESNLDLTIRAAEGFHPVLVLGDTEEAHAALFRLYDGKLRLEGLEFRLSPQKPFPTQTLVAMDGEGKCEFKDCLITLDQAGQKTDLSLASILDVGEMMKGNPRPAQGLQLALDGCFIRGDGDLLSTRCHRPFELAAANTLVALKGSLLTVQPRTESPVAPPNSVVKVQLTKVTTYLGGHLIAWNWKTPKEARGLLTPVQIGASGCAFLPANGVGTSLVRMDISDTEEKDRLKEKLLHGNNACGAYASLYDQPAGGEMKLLPLTPERWADFTGERMSKFSVSLAGLLPTDSPFTRMTPVQFKLVRDPNQKDSEMFGADLERLQKTLLPPETEGP